MREKREVRFYKPGEPIAFAVGEGPPLRSVSGSHSDEVFFVKLEEVPALFSGKVGSATSHVVLDGRLVPNDHEKMHAAAVGVDRYLFCKGKHPRFNVGVHRHTDNLDVLLCQ